MSRLLFVVLSLFVLSACQAEPEEKNSSTSTPKPSETVEVVIEPEDQILLLDDQDSPTQIPPSTPDFILEDDYEIVTLLPYDAIPAIDDPQYYDVEEADREYDPDELVIGIDFNGEARAYSVPLLSRHEIVNDTVGGVKLSVTW